MEHIKIALKITKIPRGSPSPPKSIKDPQTLQKIPQGKFGQVLGFIIVFLRIFLYMFIGAYFVLFGGGGCIF
jgi:hypothetical protein